VEYGSTMMVENSERQGRLISSGRRR